MSAVGLQKFGSAGIPKFDVDSERLADAILQEKDPFPLLERLIEEIPLKSLEEAVRLQSPDHTSALETARHLLREAEIYLEAVQGKAPIRWRAKVDSLMEKVISVIESVLNAFGVAEFFKPAENDMHADFKGQKIMLLLSLFTMLSAVIVPILGAALGGMVVGGCLLGVAALSLLYPLVRPAPARLPKAANWTRQFREGQLEVSETRKDRVDEIAQTLIASDAAKVHVMLLGKSGVGKTETVKALVQAIERGDYPELKGKEVFYINTADLVNNTEMFTYGNRILSRLSEEMGQHRKKYILIFDEIHMACQSEETAIADQMKTLLDDAKENFPYVIGITTEEDYYRDIYVKHSAFARRFKRITVENTSDVETLQILNNAILKKAPKLIVETGALAALIQKTKEAFGADAPMPSSALRILSQCIQRTADSQKSPLEKKVEVARLRVQAHYLEGAARQGENLLAYSTQGELLEAELSQIEERFKKERQDLGRLIRMRDLLMDAKKKTFQAALKVVKSAREKDQKLFLFLGKFVAPALDRTVRKESDRLGVQAVVNEALIDRAIGDELASDRRAKEAIARGRQEIEARA
jgi:MoxR-like ATPase